MSLTDLASLGSLISSLAVVVTLIFLLLQMRQTERNQRALMQQGRANRISDASLRLIDPELAPLFGRGRRGDDTMAAEDVSRFLMICRAAFVSGEDSFLQYQAGTFHSTSFDSFVAGMRSFFVEPGMRAAWRLSADQYGAEFRAFMDKVMRETPAAAPNDVVARWQAALAADREGRDG